MTQLCRSTRSRIPAHTASCRASRGLCFSRVLELPGRRGETKRLFAPVSVSSLICIPARSWTDLHDQLPASYVVQLCRTGSNFAFTDPGSAANASYQLATATFQSVYHSGGNLADFSANSELRGQSEPEQRREIAESEVHRMERGNSAHHRQQDRGIRELRWQSRI